MSEQTPADTLAADVLAIVQRMTARYAAIDRQRAAKQLQAAVERYREQRIEQSPLAAALVAAGVNRSKQQ